MALTYERKLEIAQHLAEKRRSMGESAFNAYVSKLETAPSSPFTETPEEVVDNRPFLQKVGTGSAKELASTGIGIGSIGRKIQTGISRGADKLFGTKGFGLGGESVFDQGEKRQRAEAFLRPEGGAEKFGSFATKIAEFAVPGSQASKLTAGAGLGTRALAQGFASGFVSTAAEGKLGKEQAVSALFGAGSVVAGDVLKAGFNKLSKVLPERLVQPLLKQTPTAKQQGKDITSYLVDSGRVGSLDDLISQSDEAMSGFNNQIDDILKAKSQQGAKVSITSLIDDVVDDINNSGGRTSADEVRAILQKTAFKSKGTLSGDVVSLKDANTLRSQLDDALYRGKDYLNQTLPENREILKQFTNSLRSNVQTQAPKTAPLFSQFSKEITLKEALIKASVASTGRNALNIMDIIVGTGAFGASGGNPITAAAAVGGRRAFETPLVKTTLAQIFRNSDKAAEVLASASPATRGAILAFISELEEDEETNPSE